MGEVLLKYKILPDSEYLDKIDEIVEKLKNIKGYHAHKIEDIGFGIKAIIVDFIVDDKEGDIIEEELNKIEGIEFETIGATLL